MEWLYMMNKLKLITIIFLIFSSTTYITTSCTDKETNSKSGEPFSLDIMTINHSGEPMVDDSPIKKLLEEYTNTKIEFIWINNSVYEDKLNITLASDELPTIITVPEKTPSVINAARAGLFWDLTPYLNEYPNLSKADPVTLKNISIDGKVYGIYRSRPLGRHGITYRKDWFDKLGLEKLTTIDDFYHMLRAFTYEDPDGNEKNDTYGLAMCKYTVPWDIMSIWFGAPNKWGLNSEGKLVPAHTTEQYRDALRFFRKLYVEKLVNQDFAVLDSSMWMEELKGGKAGAVVDVLDHARRLQDDSNKYNKGSEYDVVGSLVGPYGLRNMPTSGYSGFHVITKSGAKTESEAKRVLKFLDQLNDREMQILLNNGIEGRHFRLEDGYAIEYISEQLRNEKGNINQLHMGIPKDLSYVVMNTPIREKTLQVMKENENILIYNPAEGLTSDAWAQKGEILDNIIEQARLKYITGRIDDEGLEEEFKRWEQSGGKELIEEINELYLQSRQTWDN